MKDKFNNQVGPQIRVEQPKSGWIIPALAIIVMIAGLQSATQFFAYEFGYQPQLGVSYHHIYKPCTPKSLVNFQSAQMVSFRSAPTSKGSIFHREDVWFDEECEENVLFSDQYDFVISLIHFANELVDQPEDGELQIDRPTW